MTQKTLIVTFAALALALAGGCKKKDKEPGKDPGAGSVKDPGAGSMKGSATDPGTGSAPAVTPLTGDKLAQAFIDHWGAWNAGDRAKFEANYDANVVTHRPDSEMPPATSAKGVADEAFMFRTGFPDGKGAAQLVLVNGRTVAAAVLITGTNSAPMKSPMGEMPPTNKKLGMMVFHAVTYNDANKIVDDWWIMDGNTFAAQLGMSPQPGRPVMEKGADAPTIAVAADSDTEKANLAAAMKGIEDFNKHDVPALMAGWTDDGIESDQAGPADVVGKAEIEKGTKMFVGAFSDGKIAPVVTLAAGDYVVQVSTFTGTNDGDMGDMMKKTGKSMKMTVAEFTHFQGGKVKQLWRFWDSSAMAKQLGLMGDPAAPPAAPPAVPADKVPAKGT